jgi:hypothetical protein
VIEAQGQHSPPPCLLLVVDQSMPEKTQYFSTPRAILRNGEDAISEKKNKLIAAK